MDDIALLTHNVSFWVKKLFQNFSIYMGSQILAAQTDILNWYLGSERDSTQDRKDWVV